MIERTKGDGMESKKMTADERLAAIASGELTITVSQEDTDLNDHDQDMADTECIGEDWEL